MRKVVTGRRMAVTARSPLKPGLRCYKWSPAVQAVPGSSTVSSFICSIVVVFSILFYLNTLIRFKTTTSTRHIWQSVQMLTLFWKKTLFW